MAFVGFTFGIALLCVAAWMAFVLGGPDRLLDAVRFSGKIGTGANLSDRLARPWCLICSGLLWHFAVAALVLGIVRRLFLYRAIRAAQTAGVLVASGVSVWGRDFPAIYTPGNDLMFVLAARGLPAVPFSTRTPLSRSHTGLRVVGVVGTGVVTLSAVQTLLSSSVLGSLVASVGAASWLSRRDTSGATVWVWALPMLVDATSCVYIYGELNASYNSADDPVQMGRGGLTERVRRGPFAGPKTQPARVAMMRDL